MKISNCIEMLEISAPVMGSLRIIYPTLIRGRDGISLVDAGYPGQLDLFQTAIEQAGTSIDQLNTIILTHHDLDHMGGLCELLSAHPGQARLLAHETEADYVAGEKRPLKLAQLETNLDQLPAESRQFAGIMSAAYARNFTPVDRTLTDGETLPEHGGAQVIHTPGHTLGHICLYFAESKTLIAGDALVIEDGELAHCPPTINYDGGMYVNSLKKLMQFDIQTVICYHGGLYNRGDANQRIAQLAEG